MSEERAEVRALAAAVLIEMGFEGALSLAALAATPALTDCSQRVQAAVGWMMGEAPAAVPAPAPAAAPPAPPARQAWCAEASPSAARTARTPAVPLRVEEVDPDFVRCLPERIRSELPAILAQVVCKCEGEGGGGVKISRNTPVA
eukprot:CAMPEP_0180003612 /NCGR_PEP_ID=MMETSP0984-20121128/11631_1 /TAXON_ID=483367 /ORGANISM="non described non described, Strain CCMP 2436" /LENGTH=144 /DNA_ID=CAMNT_0021924021 /DNA_START=244 /DNA_END=678 /DNA_ORIENTATION=-